MDYKEKYEKALERAKELYSQHCAEWRDEDIEAIFPELKESEDEKVRKEIIDFLKLPHPQFVGKRDHEKWIAWLEKQKPAEPIIKDDDVIADTIRFKKQKHEWTEEDEYNLKHFGINHL